MRSKENKEENNRMYEDDLLDAYIRRYVSVSKQMVEDYKRHAINAYLTETHA